MSFKKKKKIGWIFDKRSFSEPGKLWIKSVNQNWKEKFKLIRQTVNNINDHPPQIKSFSIPIISFKKFSSQNMRPLGVKHILLPSPTTSSPTFILKLFLSGWNFSIFDFGNLFFAVSDNNLYICISIRNHFILLWIHFMRQAFCWRNLTKYARVTEISLHGPSFCLSTVQWTSFSSNLGPFPDRNNY